MLENTATMNYQENYYVNTSGSYLNTSASSLYDLETTHTYYQNEYEATIRLFIATLIDEGKDDSYILKNISVSLNSVKDISYKISDETIIEMIKEIRNDDLQWASENNKLSNNPGALLEIYSADEAMGIIPETKWVIEKLISESSVNIFYGKSGIGKTWGLMNLAVSVALGKDWLGFEIKNPSHVLIVDEESGKNRMITRLNKIMNGLNAGKGTPLNIVNLPGFSLDGKSKADRKDDWTKLKSTIDFYKSKLVIIDSFSDVMSGDENTKKDTQPLLMNLRKLADATNCAILLIHHAGKNGDFRGSSAIAGAIDLMVKISRKNDSKIINFKTEKERDIEFIFWDAEMIWDDSNENKKFLLKQLTPESSQDKKQTLNKTQNSIYEYFETNGDSSNKQIEDNTIFSNSTIRKAISDLIKLEKVERKNTGEKGTEAIYGVC